MRASVGLSVEQNEQDAMAMAEMFDAIDRCPAPVIARVQGAALGGGMGLCAVSDLVIAEAGAKFGFTETRLGILPAVISPFVIAKIGETHARALFPGGRRFDATRALRIGLVHEVVEGDDALDRAVEAAVADLLAAGPTAARAAKAVVREVRGLPHASTRWHTARHRRQRASAEGQEGLRAFLEKREPAWTASRSRARPTDRRARANVAAVHSAAVDTERDKRDSHGRGCAIGPGEAARRLGVCTRTVQRWLR